VYTEVVHRYDGGVFEPRRDLGLTHEPGVSAGRQHLFDGDRSPEDTIERAADLAESSASEHLAKYVAPAVVWRLDWSSELPFPCGINVRLRGLYLG
jgi:hypothetical protein